MQPAQLDLRIIQCATFRKPLLMMQPVYAYKPISSIQQTAPLRLTVTGHGMPDGWPTWIEGVSGWSELNRDKTRERFRAASVIDADTIEYNDLNGLGKNATGGVLVYQLPLDMTGATARMNIRDSSGTLLLDLTTANGKLVVAGPGKLLIELTAAETAAIDLTAAVYDLELVMADGSVDRWAQGAVTVSLEQTHD